jgi:hypothetical protein
VRRDNERGTTIKGNDGVRWNSDSVLLLLWRRQNENVVEWWESDQYWDNLFITVEGESQAVCGGWPVVMVWIQCFNFGSRRETRRWIIIGRWNGSSKFVLAPCEGNVTRHGGMKMSVRGEATSGREKWVDDVSWANANLTGPEIKKDSHSQFSYYK